MERILIPILIIGGAIALFVGTFIWNRKTKVPENTPELPEQCMSCHNDACKSKAEEQVVKNKKNKNEMTPDELIDYLACEEKNNEQK